ncbi:MAG: PorP/SprF family type IX secretion system membrane protein, partial [Vicingaceae bacterium]
DFNKLVFNDQISRGGSAATSDDIGLNTARYADFTTGLLVYSEAFWAGIAFNHINEPNQSLGDGDSPLYMKFSAHGGYKFNLSETGGRRVLNSTYLNVVGHYKSQQKYDQLDLGVYYTRDPLVFGLWYRGIPLLKSHENKLNNDAVAIVLGYKLSDYNLNIGYSYDVTISRLAANSAGSHEVSIVYELASKKKKRKRRKFFVPCAKF